jgi:hypothetical protein
MTCGNEADTYSIGGFILYVQIGYEQGFLAVIHPDLMQDGC